jgi:hypothetical protein
MVKELSMMRTVAMTGALILSVLVATRAYSRDDKYVLPIKAALDSAEPRQKPDGLVKFFFGKESTPRIASSLGSVKPHGKARTRRSDDIEACNVAFLAALIDFEQRAKKAGANAVVNIVSYYKNVEMASATKFECHAGAAAHAILRGDLVKLVDYFWYFT